MLKLILKVANFISDNIFFCKMDVCFCSLQGKLHALKMSHYKFLDQVLNKTSMVEMSTFAEVPSLDLSYWEFSCFSFLLAIVSRSHDI